MDTVECEIIEHKINLPTPLGTEIYKFCVRLNQGASEFNFPWHEGNTNWIETYPPCNDVWAKEDEIKERIEFFQDKPVSIGNIKKIRAISDYYPPDIKYKLNCHNIPLERILDGRPFRLQFMFDKQDSNMVTLPRSSDLLYDFENVDTVFCGKYGETNIDLFTEDTPLNIYNCQYIIFYIKIKDKNLPVSFTGKFYNRRDHLELFSGWMGNSGVIHPRITTGRPVFNRPDVPNTTETTTHDINDILNS